jgi:hypothetical protein
MSASKLRTTAPAVIRPRLQRRLAKFPVTPTNPPIGHCGETGDLVSGAFCKFVDRKCKKPGAGVRRL